MGIESLYGWLIVVAFAFFTLCLGWVSETTEARLRSRDKTDRRS